MPRSLEVSRSRLKVATIVGTRPEIIKLSRVINELDRYVDHVIVHTGQNYDYELNEVFFEDLGIRKPDHFLNAAGTTAADTIGSVIAKSDALLREIRPDAILLYGDTNSCLSVIAAKRLKIPVFHMEAGNRCFDQRVPEEINRRIVDHLSDVNMTLTEHARRYLLSEGIKPELTFVIGSSMPEVLAYHQQAIAASTILEKLSLDRGGYFVVSSHREENVDSPEKLLMLLDGLDMLAERFEKEIIVSTHPRTRNRLGGAELERSPRVRFMKPLGFLDYVKLQQEAFCVVSDSGTLTEEASILGFPAVMIREAHERPEGMDVGTLIMSGLDPERLCDSVSVVTSQATDIADGRAAPLIAPRDYMIEDVARKVVRIILSYTGYINRTVWSK
ncbi:UDP-N-acetylglucosamine 2-epimerase [Rhizobium leguminosarum bv. trifolii WSM2297]|uniref:UDP-N-acetylglucosamine 2-epimerase n=1 Tax=Rhizobium leguminosarum bv. trifolii WSM2297 TaxID=754762 RepID=J0KY31_RHILT|nr:UDP-N-acetylglucosamine 2-epimerase (non-hydrolyzing) [Rhizobium leguminosarum]EJC82689.1 UDP-N-acetylglucosamine 2-epimerase [Rhizobium leguminosarum bv. trifolii WSM2297]